MRSMAASRRALRATCCSYAWMAVLTTDCSSAWVSMDEPSLAVFAMPASTLARLSAVTPVMPRAAKSAALKSGAGVGTLLWAASVAMARVVVAKASILLTRSTAPALRWAMVSLSRVCAAEPLVRLAAVVAPIAL